LVEGDVAFGDHGAEAVLEDVSGGQY
jgi:hypothetical protein